MDEENALPKTVYCVDGWEWYACSSLEKLHEAIQQRDYGIDLDDCEIEALDPNEVISVHFPDYDPQFPDNYTNAPYAPTLCDDGEWRVVGVAAEWAAAVNDGELICSTEY